MRIAIVDYGVGNVRSVERALAHVGAVPVLTADADEMARAGGVVLPGVGAFAPALRRLAARGLGRRLIELARDGKPVLGVCLGYQLLFDESTEHGVHEGLGLLPGTVDEVKTSERLPVMGWCQVRQSQDSELWDGIHDRAYFYFVHSFTPGRTRHAVGASEHSPAAAAVRGRVMGTQFHPEKSGPDGLRVYANFVALCA
ncbi:MAG TPA: imidazole glycerol phosphate synthase subunit HisH [Candidatus Dormibacteraeota bacterium]|nr:imidazole glycerol phosphate synthase subunit HisH [Candidatus Dormibacteraeota bacterium]